MTNAAPLPSSPHSEGFVGPDELVALEAPLRRYVLSRVGDPHRADDIVQETLLRTLRAASELEIETLTAYAIAVARNEISTHVRTETTARRHLPRLLDMGEPLRPDDVLSANESRDALAAALADLPPRTRLVLLAHDVDKLPLAEIAKEERVRPGALAAQLHRTRARLRVDYVVALRHATLPTTRCRSVLMAISASDKRQQRALNAGEHLASCSVCDELGVPLVSRDRTLAGSVPWFALGAPQGVIEGWVRNHPWASSGAAVVAAGAVGAILVTALTGGNEAPEVPTTPLAASTASSASVAPSTSPAPTPSPVAPPSSPGPVAVPDLTSSGRVVVPARSQLGSAASAPVVATGVVVLSVPGNEGFWVGDAEARIWVQMTGKAESPLQVTAGMRMSFEGTLVVNGPTFVGDLALQNSQDREALDAIGIHVEVPQTAITVVS